MSTHERNVGTAERTARIGGGALAAFAGAYAVAGGPPLWLAGLGLAAIALGLDFIYTGLTGYCPLYAKLGWSSVRRGVVRATPPTAAAAAGAPAGSVRVVLPVADLACGGGDALAVERTIAKTVGVLRAYVNPVTERAYIDYDPGRVTAAAITASVRDLGVGRKGHAR